MNTLDTLLSLFHPGALSEARTWLCLAALAAAGVAGWYCADLLYEFVHRNKGDE
jgi:hypothetical protein